MIYKFIAYLLIALGASDLIVWIFNGFSFGWFEFVVGVNPVSKFGAAVLIMTGSGLLAKEKANYQSKLDDVDLDEGESIVHKEYGKSAILTITQKRVRFFGFDMKELRNYEDKNKNFKLPQSDKEDYLISAIQSAQPVKQLGFFWGLTLTLKDGDILHIPISNAELVAKHIEKQLSRKID